LPACTFATLALSGRHSTARAEARRRRGEARRGEGVKLTGSLEACSPAASPARCSLSLTFGHARASECRHDDAVHNCAEPQGRPEPARPCPRPRRRAERRPARCHADEGCVALSSRGPPCPAGGLGVASHHCRPPCASCAFRIETCLLSYLQVGLSSAATRRRGRGRPAPARCSCDRGCRRRKGSVPHRIHPAV